MKDIKTKEQIIAELKEYFANQPDTLIAYLFGSQSKDMERTASDWDIAVYLNEENRSKESKIWNDLEKIVGQDVDFVVLNRAPATLSWRILSQGEELINKNRNIFLDLLISSGDEANDFFETSKDYYQIFLRSASLSAIDRERLERIAIFLSEEIKEYKRFKKLTHEEYFNNRTKKRDVEHWIEHLVNAVIDVAKIILASEHKPIPETYYEIFFNLSAISSFDQNNLCAKMSQWVKLRNILAHEYLDIRWKNVSEFASQTEFLWQDFTENLKDFLTSSEIQQ